MELEGLLYGDGFRKKTLEADKAVMKDCKEDPGLHSESRLLVLGGIFGWCLYIK